MIQAGNQIACVPGTLPVIEFLRDTIFCPNRKQFFLPKNWQQNIKPAGHNTFQHEITQQYGKFTCVLLENFSVQQN